MHPNVLNKRQGGFSLVELTIVVVILGVLAMMAVPRYRAAVEGSKASEAFVFLQEVQRAQESYNARKGIYAKKLAELDLQLAKPQFFKVGQFTSYDWQTQWQLRLTRDGASSGYGAYTVVFNQGGFLPAKSSIPSAVSPTGVGGKLSAGSGGGGGASPPQPQPTGALKWSRDDPLSYDDYLDHMFEANRLDYKPGQDPDLDWMFWAKSVLDRWFKGVVKTPQEHAQDFLDMKRSDYQRGQDFWLDLLLSWNYSRLRWRHGW